MSKHPRPVLHRRDHEHGGTDPVRIQWEQTGEAGGGGTGIQFNTDNEGGWLDITTNDTDEELGVGMSLFDDSGGGIHIAADGGGPVTLTATGGGGIRLDSTSTDDGLEIMEESTDTGGHGLVIQSIRNQIRIETSGAETGSLGCLLLVGLPTADPHLTNAVWNDGGVLMISAG